MNREPVISIVLPTHNGARYLSQSIQSCVEQTCQDWELILVDDASTDQTPAIIRQWLGRDARIRGVFLSRNRKLPGALNAGFQSARGRFFTWTSDDNWYGPDALERMHRVLAGQPQLGVVYAGMHYVDEDGVVFRHKAADPHNRLYMDNVVGACFLYRRDVQERLRGYDEQQFLVEDYDFWLRASNLFAMEAIAETLYYYRWHATSLTHTRQRDIRVRTTRALMRWLPQAHWLADEERIAACVQRGQAAVELDMYGEFEPWLAASEPWLGTANQAAVRRGIEAAILRAASAAYWARDWQALEKYRSYVARQCDPQVQWLVKKPRFPTWVYRIRDAVDGLFPLRRSTE